MLRRRIVRRIGSVIGEGSLVRTVNASMKPDRRRAWRRPLGTAAALAAVAAYYLIRFHDALLRFFFLDDFWNMAEAARIHIRSPLGLAQLVAPTHNGFTLYRPLTQTDYFYILHALFGYDPTGYHAVQLLAHIANACLILLITRRLAQSAWVGLAAALIYASAPGHLVAIYWVSAFSMTGTTLVLLLMLWLWLATSGRRRVLAVTLAQVAALLASEHGIVGPVLLAAVALLSASPEPARRVLRQLGAPAACVAAYLAAKLVYLRILHPMPVGSPYAPAFDLGGWVARTGRYAVACFDFLTLAHPGDTARLALGAALLALPCLAIALRLRRGAAWDLLAIGSVIFVVSLLPVLPLRHHTYDYFVGTAAFGGALIVLGLCRLAGPPWRVLAVVVAAVVATVDLSAGARIARRDDALRLVVGGLEGSARWLETLRYISVHYPQIERAFVPSTPLTDWMFKSGADGFFRPPRPTVILFDPRRPPSRRPRVALLWGPLAPRLLGDQLPGWSPGLRWLRRLAGG